MGYVCRNRGEIWVAKKRRKNISWNKVVSVLESIVFPRHFNNYVKADRRALFETVEENIVDYS
jgi:hypothetical protein